MSQRKIIGIIDLGSNSSRLSIFEHYSDDSYRPVFEMKRSLQLAHYLRDNAVVSEQGIERAVACTRLFLRAGELYGVTKWIAVATAAIRQAHNRDQILGTLQAETGISFRVLEGKEEGYYGYLAVVNTLDVEDVLIFDIGGASSELMYVKSRNLLHVTSIPFGALSLTDKFSGSKSDAGAEIRSFFRAQLRQIPWIEKARHLPLVGLGGTARSAAKLHSFRTGTKLLHSTHGYEVDPEFILEQFAELAKTDPAKISKIKGISKRRAGIITAGLAAISAIHDEVTAPTLLISRNGIREGLFFEYYLEDRVPPVVDSVLEESLNNFLKIYDVRRPVADTVTRMALWFFDVLQDVHALTAIDRKLLRVTALIESCGTYINTEKWARHSAYLALSSNLYGLSYNELTDVADLLGGGGTPRLKKILGLIQMAKLFSLQLGVSPTELEVSMTKSTVYFAHATLNLADQVMVSADANIAAEFQTLYGRDLKLS